MTKTCFLLVMMSLFLLTACEEEEQTGPTETDNRTVNPLRCQDGGDGCDMNWNITKSRNKFPEYIQILINDKVIHDECKATTRIAVTRNVDKVIMTIWDYIRLDGKQDFKFQINDLKNCFESKTVFYQSATQGYLIEDVNGEKHVQIDLK
jgi:hypothetical protein